MKKLLTILFGTACLGMPALGETLTPSQALERVFSGFTRSSQFRDYNLSLALTKHSGDGEACLYIFDNTGGGFMILSADDVAAPVLGYSDNGRFDATDVPPQLEWWLSEYSRQIEYARENGLPTYSYSGVRNGREPVVPLLKTSWNQNSPYNNDCPVINRRKAPTGCVATAMAQIMKRWDYPERGTGTGSITLPGTDKTETMLLGAEPFDWDNMLLSYSGDYNENQAKAVAYLMKACGYAVDMNYTLSGSGAISFNAARALIDNFGYNPAIRYCERDYYTTTKWEGMIYEELANGRPVLYGGQSTSGGHEFVCDGYNADGYFHFNWGWGGMSDGYFTLDALNPDAVGTGGGEGGGFNFSQDIIIGIQPTPMADSGVAITQMGNLSVSEKSGIFIFSLSNNGWWVNMGLSEADVELGFSIEPMDTTSGNTIYVSFGSKVLSPPVVNKTEEGTYLSYYGWTGRQMKGIPSGLADGEYKVTLCCRSNGSRNGTWTPVLASSDCYNYAIFTKTGSSYSFHELPYLNMVIKEGMPASELFYGCAAKFALTIENKSDRELTRGFYPRLYLDDKMQMSGEGIVVTLQPGETATKEFTTVFSLDDEAFVPSVEQDYTLCFYDPITATTFDWAKNVTMRMDPGEVSIVISDFKMEGLNSSLIDTPNNGYQMVYDVVDKSVIPFSCEITNTGDFFGYPVAALIFPESLKGNNLASVNLGPTPTLGKGESAEIEGILDFSDAESNAIYAAAIFIDKADGLEQAAGAPLVFFKIASSGVTEISDNGDDISMTYERESNELKVTSSSTIKNVSVMTLSGAVEELPIKACEAAASASLSHLPKGIYVVTATDADGRSRSMKIAK